jgi:hypothetical protein
MATEYELANRQHNKLLHMAVAESMSSAAVFPARTSHSQEKARALAASAAAYGRSTPELLGKFDRDTPSLKTSQLSLFGGLTEFSGTYGRSGMTRSGTAYQLPPLVRLTEETGSGSLATPQARDYRTGEGHRWNTPEKRSRNLNDQIAADVGYKMWPTPHGMCVPNARRAGPSGNELGNAVNRSLWPTPTSRDFRSESCSPTYFAEREAQTRGKTLAWEAGGSLNPTWVEWLMGFPLGWTALER